MVFVRSKGKNVWNWTKARYCGEAEILPEHAIGVDLITGSVIITALQQCFTTRVLSFSMIIRQKKSSQKHWASRYHIVDIYLVVPAPRFAGMRKLHNPDSNYIEHQYCLSAR